MTATIRDVGIELKDRVGTVEIRRPPNNFFDNALIGQIGDAFDAFDRNPECRTIVLAAEGKAFCAGADFSSRPLTGALGEGPDGVARHLYKEAIRLFRTRKPIVAAVHGAAVGGGLALALACVLRVASDDAFFASQFIRVGLSSCDVGTSYTLPRVVGPTIAAELMLTGRRFTADEAARYGMVNRVVARADLRDSALDLADAVAANSEYGVYMTKLGMWTNLDAPSLRHAMELENRTQVLGTFTRNMTEAGRAFVEKRDPTWNPM